VTGNAAKGRSKRHSDESAHAGQRDTQPGKPGAATAQKAEGEGVNEDTAPNETDLGDVGGEQVEHELGDVQVHGAAWAKIESIALMRIKSGRAN
jgi:hypothetical protein